MVIQANHDSEYKEIIKALGKYHTESADKIIDAVTEENHSQQELRKMRHSRPSTVDTSNLSDKIWFEGSFLDVKDVKEFIQRLKFSLCKELYEKNRGLNYSGLDRIPQKEIITKIDKIFGDKLTK